MTDVDARLETVVLTYPEMESAASEGIHRVLRASLKRRQPRWESTVYPHILGALGECAYAKWAGIFWALQSEPDGGDVARVQVRTVDRPSNGLILHRTDDDDAVHVLMEWMCPSFSFVVVGWLEGVDGKQEQWWEDRAHNGHPAFFVPRAALHSPDELHTIRWSA